MHTCHLQNDVARKKMYCSGKRLNSSSTACATSSQDLGNVVRDTADQAASSIQDSIHQAQNLAKDAMSEAQKTSENIGDAIEEAAGGDDDIPDFDLPTAVAMGVSSFEAYNEPGPMIGVTEGSETGTYKLYLDEDFLREKLAGILQVHVRWVTGVPAAVSNDDDKVADKDDEKDEKGEKHKGGDKEVSADSSDHGGSAGDVSPYVTIAVGPAVGITSVAKKSQQAAWRETFFLNVRDVESKVVVKLFNAADGREEEPANRESIASTSVDLKQFTDGRLHDAAMDLGCGAAVGLSFHYTPLSDTSFEEIQARSVSQMLTDDWSGDEANNVTSFDNSLDGWFDPGRQQWQTLQNMFDSSVAEIFTASSPRLQLEEANRLADNQPQDRDIFKQWTGLLEDVVSRELTTKAPPLAFVTNPATDTELWVYRNAEERDLIFAFRGTSSPKDMITDMSVELRPFKPGQKITPPSDEEVTEQLGASSKVTPVIEKIRTMEEYVGRLTGYGTKQLGLAKWVTSQAQMVYASENDEVWVHKGFLSCYQSVAASLLELAEEVMEGDEPWTIFTTGHSMGGALATLCAYEFAQHDFKRAPQPKIQMWGFGSPRVGNIPFADAYDKLDIVTWRISNLKDVVTKVPSLLGFKHVGVEVRLLGEGEIAVKKGTFDDVREGTTFNDLVDIVRDGAFGKDKQMQRKFREIVREEMKLAKSILKGDAMKEHMEDYYYEAVKLAVEAAGDGCSAKMVAQEAVQEAAADKEGGDGGAGGKSKNKDSEEDQGTTDSRDKHEDNEQSRKSSAESHERKTEERSGANTSGSTTSTSGSSGDQPEDNSENTENDKSATSKRERNQQNGGSQSLEGGPAGSNAHEEGSKGPERRDEPANSDYGGALATASADRNNEAEARTENGGSGNRTGKRPGTVGGGIGKGKGESDRRRLPEDDDDTDASDEGGDDSDLESLDDEFSTSSDTSYCGSDQEGDFSDDDSLSSTSDRARQQSASQQQGGESQSDSTQPEQGIIRNKRKIRGQPY